MEDEYRVRRKLEMLSSPLVKEILEDSGMSPEVVKARYKQILFDIEATKRHASKWKQLDLEEAIENEKKEKK